MASAKNPAPHPEPPKHLSTQNLPLIQLQQSWFRIHQSRYEPLHFGNSGYRFDASGQEYRILYIAQYEQGAFIETFGTYTGIRIISNDELSLRSISCLQHSCPLNLVDLTGPGLAKIGADSRLCDSDHPLAQRWALAFWQHPMQVDGIYYRARHDPSQYCAAIFDRAAEGWHVTQTLRCASQDFRGILANILDRYEFGLIE
ncbi:RES family NAD+ phosphorylase [Altericista sp. CCNU0014]|uniref:RES family NAD+ phosphorylase n=1 Tax=Altericista sp. CCNU0014 TaxID=3082949 RepID=UPI00384CEEBE